MTVIVKLIDWKLIYFKIDSEMFQYVGITEAAKTAKFKNRHVSRPNNRKQQKRGKLKWKMSSNTQSSSF